MFALPFETTVINVFDPSTKLDDTQVTSFTSDDVAP